MTGDKTLENGGPVAYIRKVGRGKTLARDLGVEEAREAFTQLLAGKFTPAQTGAFLQALRIKELTQNELEGLMKAVHDPAFSALPLPTGGFVLNLASDTPRKGGYASLLAAGLLALDGMPVGIVLSDPMLSGNDASWDETWRVVVRAAGAIGPPTGLTGSPQAGSGSAGLPLPPVVEAYDLNPALRNLQQVRRELGFRSCLHTAEKLLNPWPDKTLVLGISHRHYAERMATHLRGRGLTGKIVLGNHGTPDLALHKETEICEILPGGEIRTIHIHPGDLGLEPDPAVYSLDFFPKWEGEMAREGFGVLGPVLLYHTAFLRYVAGEVSHLKDGLVPFSQPFGVA